MPGSWRAVLVALAAVAAVLVPPPPQAQAADRVVTYSVTSQGTVRGDLGEFAAVAAATLADPRGWSLGGALAFSRVPSGGDFTLVLAAPSVIGRLAGCDAFYSCRVGRNVYINDDRWRTATSTWPHGVPYYRQYVITHEVGHWLGLGHSNCPGAGRLGPRLLQGDDQVQRGRGVTRVGRQHGGLVAHGVVPGAVELVVEVEVGRRLHHSTFAASTRFGFARIG